ncbi:MAG: hypothetical protein WBE68_25080 [Candidatus Nitrosopolaris sp.]
MLKRGSTASNCSYHMAFVVLEIILIKICDRMTQRVTCLAAQLDIFRLVRKKTIWEEEMFKGV